MGRSVSTFFLPEAHPVSDFEQRAADISVDHPLVLEHYRSAHEIAVRQTQRQASPEELQQAMIYYRALFEELVGVTELARTKTTSLVITEVSLRTTDSETVVAAERHSKVTDRYLFKVALPLFTRPL